MHEIAKVTLQNEMDLILAHKRSMKLAEIAGLSLAAQTTFATAVSEVARNTIESGKKGCLVLNVEADQRDKYIVACIKDEQEYTDKSLEGLEYAKRLVNKYNISTKGKETSIELFYYIAPSFKINIHKLDEWRNFFRNEPPISAYEELKRKNEQLQDLSEKVQKSEAQYKTLTNALPLLIFSVDKEGKVVYANEWLSRYSGETVDSLNRNGWRKIVYDEDYASFSVVLNSNITSGTTALKTQVRLVNKDGEPLWHQLSLVPLLTENTEPLYWIGYMADIHAQKVVEETLKDNFVLKQTQKQLKENQHTLEQYIEELGRSNQELQQFAFVASHDLQEPVRKFIFYSDFLLSQMDDIPKERAVQSLKTIQRSAVRMRTLIRDLLVFSQIKKEATKFAPVDLAKIATDAAQDFEMAIQEKKAELVIASLPVINGDERMMGQLFENLISNSLKYARDNEAPKITISHQQHDDRIELKFEDNGIGFDEKYLPQMFTLFQRLHDRTVYEGTGLGLAICKKIVDLHQGRIWASSEEGKGATFFVSLPLNNVSNKL